MNKKELRAALKSIGYKCSFRTNPFKETLASVYLIDPNTGAKVLVSSASVFIGYEQHKDALALCAQFDGVN